MGKQVKTKFPMARIKKIMQTDEEIGKVASVVPVLVSKSVELFLQTLVEAACAETYLSYGISGVSSSGGDTSGNRRRMLCSPTHFKRCVEKIDKLDFLRPMVKDVKEVPDEEIAAASPLQSPRTPTMKKRRTSKKAAASVPDISQTEQLLTATEPMPAPTKPSIKSMINEENVEPAVSPPSSSSIASKPAITAIPLTKLDLVVSPSVSQPVSAAISSSITTAAIPKNTHGPLQEDEDFD